MVESVIRLTMSSKPIATPEETEWVMKKVVEAAEYVLAQIGSPEGVVIGEWVK